MRLVVGGCSLAWGSELADCKWPDHSMSTWPALLAQQANLEYDIVAWPASGNDSIARRVMSRCHQLKEYDKAVVVQWSFQSRYEFRFTYDTRQAFSPWLTISPWATYETTDDVKKHFLSDNDEVLMKQMKSIETNKATGIHEFAKSFYKNVGSGSYWETYTSLKEIVLLQNFLEQYKIPYLFTCADVNLISNPIINENPDSSIAVLYDQINFDNWFLFPAGDPAKPDQIPFPRGFYQWAIENKYPVGTTHPLEDAHADAAKLIQEKFDAMVKKPL